MIALLFQSKSRTALVLSESDSIGFVMPEGLTLKTTPEPLDERVKIIEIPERVVAALKFSGLVQFDIQEETKEMPDELKTAGINPLGQVFTML
jgi:hypothetical protein